MVTNFGFVTLEAFKLISQSQRLLPILKPYIVHWKTHWGKNPNLIQKSTCSKSHHSRNSHFQNTFFTKFSLSNSHFSQISHLRSPFLTKNHIFKISFFTKITKIYHPVWKRILWLHQNGFLSISTCTVYLKFSMAKKSRYYCYQKQQMFLFGSSCCASRHFILHASKTFSGKNPLQKLHNEFVFPTLISISVQLFYISIVEM